MANHFLSSYYKFLFIYFFLFISPTLSKKSTYIVHLLKPYNTKLFTSDHHWHTSILHSLPSFRNDSTILYSYTHAATGFAAQVSDDEANELRRHPSVLSIMPDETLYMDTTMSPSFLGLNDGYGLWPSSNYGSDIIIGLIDTGIWPEHPSFNDIGYGPVPTTWKGYCEVGPDFPASSCNQKVIGARIFYAGYEARYGPIIGKSARDREGHGTHCASIAAGSRVNNAGFYNYATGVAQGMAMKARIAIYKALWANGCQMSDVMAAMDQALMDGVHILSLSLSAFAVAGDYKNDPLAIAAFRASERGVVVSCAASNTGPGAASAKNIAPWILTVGASTTYRQFSAIVTLGDGKTFWGSSLYTGADISTNQLVSGADAGSSLCYAGQLIPSRVAGKIVVCDRGDTLPIFKGQAVKEAGGVGMILVNFEPRFRDFGADLYLTPAIKVTNSDGNSIKAYISSTTNPKASISFLGTMTSLEPSAPRVASFSARGPNRVTSEILKPDIIAPGVEILAGWSQLNSPTNLNIDPRRVQFNIISGTSMATPHVSGLAALLRKANPTWRPAAIKSALMTTTYNLDDLGDPIKDATTLKQATPFDYGSGHVDPNKALDPGLVYDLGTSDYIAFLCAIGYSPSDISIFTSHIYDCSTIRLSSPGNLNYPSFSVVFKSINGVVQYTRVMKNVAYPLSTSYQVKVNAPPNVQVNVSPTTLIFNTLGQALSYSITFTSTATRSDQSPSFGSIEWSDGTHRVKSPIAVSWAITNQQDLIESI